jgi:chlorite dismutase
MTSMKSRPLLVSFIGGEAGAWSVERIVRVKGAPLAASPRLAVLEGSEPETSPAPAVWILRGRTEADHYVRPLERKALDAVSSTLGRPEATAAALIPIRKSSAWWSLPDEERRAIFEERSQHIARSLAYLPRIARRLHHSHDLGEPFDFLTWFEYAPVDEPAFDELVGILRTTEEWTYVEREVDVRLRRDKRM